MANPNVASTSSLYGVTTGQTIDTTLSSIFTGTTDKLKEIVLIRATNIDGATDAAVTVSFYENANNHIYLAYEINVPAASALDVITEDAPIMLRESDQIHARSSANGDIQIAITYKEFDDA